MAHSTDHPASASDEERFGLTEPAMPEEERLRLADRPREGGVIERIEERAVIDKHIRDEGGVRVSTRTEIATDMVSDILEQVAVEVERVPMDCQVEAAEPPRVEGDVTVVPVYEERLVVEKRLFLVEEVHLRRVARTRAVEVPVEVRRQVADVERLPPLDGSPDSPTPTEER